MKSYLLSATALSVALLITTPAYADSNKELLERIEKLEQELNLLKRAAEVDKEVATAKSDKTANVELGKKGLLITSPDKNYSLAVKGYFQVDNRHFFDDEANTGRNETIARRLRPILEVTAFKDFSFRLMPDFAGGTTRIVDAHADYKLNDALKFRLGKFKPPVGLERLQSASDMFFVERGHPSNLGPSRDFGFQLYGDILPETLEYQLGIFNGNADNANTDNDADDKKDVVARVFAHPFHQSDNLVLQGLGIGLGGSYGDREGSSSSTILGSYRTPGQQSFFSYRTGAAADTTFADGTMWRLQPQAYWYYNNFGLLGEYGITSQSVTRGATTERLQHNAWQLAASYVLTGEDVSFKGGVKPANPLDVKSGDWGAFELVGRVGQTNIDDDAFPIFASATASAEKATTFGGGVNWYLNESVKLWLDYEHTQFNGGAAVGDRQDENVLLSRVQYRF